MAKKVVGVVKLQINAGKATPAPPVGPALGGYGINMMEFIKGYNEKTAAQIGSIVPVEITIYDDRSFTFITKTPPAADLLKKGEREKPGVVPGRPELSFLVELMRPLNGKAEMPRSKDPLPDHQIKTVVDWIVQGAADDTPADAAVGTPAARSASFIDGLSRHSQAVCTEVPGIVHASRTCGERLPLATDTIEPPAAWKSSTKESIRPAVVGPNAPDA